MSSLSPTSAKTRLEMQIPPGFANSSRPWRRRQTSLGPGNPEIAFGRADKRRVACPDARVRSWPGSAPFLTGKSQRGILAKARAQGQRRRREGEIITRNEADRAEWEKAENWTSGSKWLSVYFSHGDSRTWVPKRIPAHGWTLNLAKPGAVAWLIGFLVGLPSLFVAITIAICAGI